MCSTGMVASPPAESCWNCSQGDGMRVAGVTVVGRGGGMARRGGGSGGGGCGGGSDRGGRDWVGGPLHTRAGPQARLMGRRVMDRPTDHEKRLPRTRRHIAVLVALASSVCLLVTAGPAWYLPSPSSYTKATAEA